MDSLCVGGDEIGVAHDRVLHNVDPGMSSSDWDVNSYRLKVAADVPDFLHDIVGAVVDLVTVGKKTLSLSRDIIRLGLERTR